MSELPDDEHTALRTALRSADSHTMPPGLLDMGAVLRGGRRRVARRRAAAACGVAAVALAVAAVAVVPGWERQAAPAPAQSPSPTMSPSGSPSPSADGGKSDKAAELAALLADPRSMLGYTQFDGRAHSVTTLRQCRPTSDVCAEAVLLTQDGWRHQVALYLGRRDFAPWTQLLPDGSAVVVPRDRKAAVVLHPDGHTSRLIVSKKPAPAGAGTILTSAPPLNSGDLYSHVWVLDPDAATLAPLATQPPGPTDGVPLEKMADGSQVVPLRGTANALSLAVTSDGGRTWTVRDVPQPRDGMQGLSDVVAGPGGRLALRHTYDGATLAPWRELWLSDDAGRTWHQVKAAHHPDTVGSLAFTSGGTLLLTDDQKATIWRVTSDRTDLEPAPNTPSAESVSRSGGVIAAQSGSRSLVITVDGTVWRPVEPGR